MTKIKNIKASNENATAKEVIAEKSDDKKVEQLKSNLANDTATAKKEEIKDTAAKAEVNKTNATQSTKTSRARKATATKSTRTARAKAKTTTKKTAAVAKKAEAKEVLTVKSTGANLAEVLGDCEVKLIKNAGTKTASSYPINVALKNLGFEKVVKVRYTEDNWETEKEEPLKFINQENDLEEWGTVLKLNASKKNGFQYVIRYKVNDWTYWDNNFDKNYKF